MLLKLDNLDMFIEFYVKWVLLFLLFLPVMVIVILSVKSNSTKWVTLVIKAELLFTKNSRVEKTK